MNHVAHKQLTTFHLFAGAGGGILADLLLGHIPVGACEIEGYPRNVLLARQRDGILPAFPIWDDIRTLDGKPWRGLVDIVAGGFPCQDISAAGKGAGITGERSGLWKEMARVIGEIRPRYVFVENSPILTSRGLGVVLGDLAEMGYDARWGVLGAHHAGAPHKRERIWILAHSNLHEHRTHGKPEGESGEISEKHRKEGCSGRLSGTSSHAQILANAMLNGSQGSWEEGGTTGQAGLCSGTRSDEKQSLCDSNEVGRARWARTIRQADWRRQSEDTGWWATEPDVGRVAHGVASRVDRLKAIGNGQCPQAASIAWEILTQQNQ